MMKPNAAAMATALARDLEALYHHLGLFEPVTAKILRRIGELRDDAVALAEALK